MPEMKQSNHNRLDILYPESDVSKMKVEEEITNIDKINKANLNPHTGFANARNQSFGRKSIN